jgi:hypothetical protein
MMSFLPGVGVVVPFLRFELLKFNDPFSLFLFAIITGFLVSVFGFRFSVSLERRSRAKCGWYLGVDGVLTAVLNAIAYLRTPIPTPSDHDTPRLAIQEYLRCTA